LALAKCERIPQGAYVSSKNNLTPLLSKYNLIQKVKNKICNDFRGILIMGKMDQKEIEKFAI